MEFVLCPFLHIFVNCIYRRFIFILQKLQLLLELDEEVEVGNITSRAGFDEMY